ncbi:HEAT repeat-containing protein 6 isoform X1 [Maniola jurtina]|uniref:HEAT repeat-containing protein 6 isoform X1 n=2 Tax=Maniola jurtina TaxID=191418 RepID=UPI001E688902|nr:HEAT repeat-containing protein 6 isoform X1 [Maniola jurtina]
MSVSQQFALHSGELCSHLYVKDYNKETINSLINELNAKPYKAELFVGKQDAAALITSLCVNIKPIDEVLAAKTSHLMNSIVTKQNIQFDSDYLTKVIAWHIDCIKKCSDIILPDILHNMQSILQSNPHSGQKFINDLIGKQGFLTKIISGDKSNTLSTQDPLQICLMAIKCVISLLTMDENKSSIQTDVSIEVKEEISEIIVNYLMKGCPKSHDESIYCKIVISALRVLSHLYFNEQKVDIPMPEVMGICRYFILYGLVSQGNKPERIMPSQQTVAAAPVKPNPKGGKKQKIRKQRNNAIESLKKEIPVSDRSLMKDVDNFENNSAYKPASKNYLDPQKTKTCWNLTSDSDMSDVENGRETKLIALRSRVRQSAANLFLVVFKVKEKKDIFGYWWALLPDSPDENNWLLEDKSKKTLAYAGVTDPIARSRASALSVVLALLSGPRVYLSQAESSKKSHTSFIPFSVSLGYIITCMHKILVGILDSERSHAVILVALKCCAALVQATPYHKMQEGLISELVRSTRKFLVHRDITLQVGALITVGCVLSIDPKVDETLKAMEKDTVRYKNPNEQINKENMPLNDECDDFEEGYSDDEMFTAVDSEICDVKVENSKETYFKYWILDICFKNMGWLFKDNQITRCKPSAIPIILESLQVLSAIAFHHLPELLQSHITLLADVLSEMLQHEHQDVVLQSARTISIIGDAIQKLEQQEKSIPLNQCVYMWEKLLTHLSTILQNQENVPAKAVVCDCIANIGEKSFKELPGRMQMLCCTLLIGLCSDEEPAVRAAAVRALAMAVMYRSLREDIGFVSDCGENILRALAEPTLVVRTKAAWALGTLSDALVLNMKEPEIEDIDDDLLLRLLEVSIQCANDNDKVKMSATRGLGNLLRLIKNDNLQRHPQLKTLCEMAIGKLLDCACKVSNMKVRWNACYALGNAMKNEDLFTCFSGWQSKVLSSLCTLAQECKNLKVRINAAVALRAPENRGQYGDQYVPLWRGIMAAMENAANVADFNEYKHKDNLIEQLCVTLAHLCCLLKPSDLPDILDPLIFHFDCAKSLYTQSYHKLAPENASCMKILQAAKYITVDLTPENETQSQSLGMLQEIFIWDV